MSLFQAFFLLAQADSEDPSDPGFFSAPTFFFAFLGLCLIMIIVAAVFELLGQSEPEDLEKEPDEFPDTEFSSDEEVDTKEERRSAKREAKEQKKREKNEKKQAKAAAKKAKQAKKKKGKNA